MTNSRVNDFSSRTVWSFNERMNWFYTVGVTLNLRRIVRAPSYRHDFPSAPLRKAWHSQLPLRSTLIVNLHET